MIRVATVFLGSYLDSFAAWQTDALAEDPDTDMIVGGEEVIYGEVPTRAHLRRSER